MRDKSSRNIHQGPLITIRQEEVFEDIFHNYYAALCSYASKLLNSTSDAEDVVEELFVKLWERNEKFQSEDHLKAWLYRSTRNACLDLLKISGRSGQRNKVYSESFSRNQESFMRDIIRSEVMREIYLAVKNLPPQCSKVISMSYFKGLSNQEIADALGLSVHTIKNQKLRGLALLRKTLPVERSGVAFAISCLYLIGLSGMH